VEKEKRKEKPIRAINSRVLECLENSRAIARRSANYFVGYRTTVHVADAAIRAACISRNALPVGIRGGAPGFQSPPKPQNFAQSRNTFPLALNFP